MILVMSKDYAVIQAANNTPTKRKWGKVVKWRELGYTKTIKNIGTNNDLCVIAHGCKTEIGDSGSTSGTWSWSVSEFVNDVLLKYLPKKYTGDVYISACMDGVDNFSTAVRLLLDKKGELMKTSLFGENKSVSGSIPARTDIGWQETLPV